MLRQFMIQFPVILLNDLSFSSPNDVIRPRPLRPSALWHAVQLRPTSLKIWGGFTCMERTGQGNDFELNPAMKMETRHPVEGYVGNKFPSICNCEVMTVWIGRRWKNSFFAFLQNDPLRENFQNSVPKGFIALLIDVLCSNFVKFGRREIGKMVGCLHDKSFSIFGWSLAFSRIIKAALKLH